MTSVANLLLGVASLAPRAESAMVQRKRDGQSGWTRPPSRPGSAKTTQSAGDPDDEADACEHERAHQVARPGGWRLFVQSACNKPGSIQITHDHVRSGHGAWIAGPCRVPKLTVRVRFPLPAPHAKSVAAQSNRTLSPTWVSTTRRRQKSALVPLPRAINHLGKCSNGCAETLGKGRGLQRSDRCGRQSGETTTCLTSAM